MAFSESLRRLLLEHFFSQAELARRSGVHGVQPRELASPEEVAEADRREHNRELKR